MNRKNLINELKKCRVVDANSRIVIKTIDYSRNPLVAVDTGYTVYYSSGGARRKSTYFGQGLGFQG